MPDDNDPVVDPEKYVHERTFPASYTEAWMRRGIWPPPLHANPDRPESVILMLSFRDLWDPAGPALDVSDDEGVRVQERACHERMTRMRQKYSGQDPIVIALEDMG
jgi:hypothetical protein